MDDRQRFELFVRLQVERLIPCAFAAASAAGLLDPTSASIVVTAVTLSMALSSQSDRLLALLQPHPSAETIDEDYAGAGGTALIVGFSRFGQLVSQPLMAVPVTLIDSNAKTDSRSLAVWHPCTFRGRHTARCVAVSRRTAPG